MSAQSNRILNYRNSLAGEKVDKLWEGAHRPMLACTLLVKHAITNLSEEVQLLVTEGRSSVSYFSSENHASKTQSISREILSTEEVVEMLEDAAVFELDSVRQRIYDGVNSELAVRDSHRVNFYSEHSVNTKQSELRDTILRFAVQSGVGPQEKLPPAEIGMPFVEISPKLQD